MSDISKRQISFFGYIMKKDEEYLAATGKIVGEREHVGGEERCSLTNL